MSTQVQERTTFERQLLTAELTRSVALSPQTRHLELAVTGVEEFRFVPGQFVSIKQPRPDGKVHTRAYSIASAPRAGASFDVCLNRIENGFLSNWLCDLPVGASVQFHGPHGLFVLREPRQDAVFIATGTGIAPIRGMIQWLFERPERNRGHEYWLVFGTRYESSIYYRDEFEGIAAGNPNFHYVPTLSRCGNDWQGCRGYVQDHVREIVSGRGDMQAYICGLHQMVDANRKLLKDELGWERTRIVFERYD
ncbi:MAG TPA: FAD-dependent oxidoreductase [Candidatus Binatia bacterium]|nr:FAD-dependent oxidoreductase [Candidatus Binatia bacterium]